MGHDFVDVTSDVQVTIESIGLLDLIKIKDLRTSKGTINRVKRKPTEWKETFANHIGKCKSKPQ